MFNKQQQGDIAGIEDFDDLLAEAEEGEGAAATNGGKAKPKPKPKKTTKKNAGKGGTLDSSYNVFRGTKPLGILY